jgi:L-iditol 2-dehydrogenase
MGTPIMTIPLGAAALREVDLRGVFRYSNTYPEAIELVSRHDPEGPDFSKLVTHKFRGLEQAEKAFQMAGKTKDDEGKLVIKVIIDLQE